MEQLTKTKGKKAFVSVDLLQSIKNYRQQHLETIDKKIIKLEEQIEQVKPIEVINDYNVAKLLGRSNYAVDPASNLRNTLDNLKDEKRRLLIRLEVESTEFSRAEIQCLAHAYALRFLDAKHYKMNYPEGITKAIEACCKKNNLSLNDCQAYILAPAHAFNLEADPVLFLTKKYDHDTFFMVKKWGKDFTIFRRLLSADFKVSRWLLGAILTIVMVVGYWMFLNNATWYSITGGVFISIVGAILALMCILLCPWVGTTNNESYMFYDPDKWDRAIE